MLKCATTENYQLFQDGPYNSWGNLSNMPDEYYIFSSIYLHGEIQEEAGFDIVYWLEGDFQIDLSKGIHDCEVFITPDDSVKCKFYCWNDESWVNRIHTDQFGKKWKVIRKLGLIIKPNDITRNYVEKCFREERSYL